MLKKYFLILACLAAVFFSGCASIPQKEKLALYEINGVNYVSLDELCKAKGIDYDYDAFGQTLTLIKGAHKINLMLGLNLAVVDGEPQSLRHKVDFYQGKIVLPYKFKEEVIDTLFKTGANIQETACPIFKIKKIVIDPGHGGFDPGTTGRSGITEKEVNLDIALRLAKTLKSCGIEVVMTRASDRFIPLEKRAEIANKAKADIFISIHSNASRVRSLKGFEVYYISPGNDHRRAEFSADNAALDIDQSCFDYPTHTLKAILWDMIYTYNRAQSLRLARSISRSVNSDLNVKILGIKGAGFVVLRGTHMPAVLIEVGFLSNGGDERMLKNSSYRQQIAEAIAQGIKIYSQDYLLTEALN